MDKRDINKNARLKWCMKLQAAAYPEYQDLWEAQEKITVRQIRDLLLKALDSKAD